MNPNRALRVKSTGVERGMTAMGLGRGGATTAISEGQACADAPGVDIARNP
jgi:hypothetical protein